MIESLAVIVLVTGAGFGWYGHRAWLRIDAWGRNMNDRDAIIRLDGEEQFEGELNRIHVLRFDDPAALRGRASQPIHPDAIAAK